MIERISIVGTLTRREHLFLRIAGALLIVCHILVEHSLDVGTKFR